MPRLRRVSADDPGWRRHRHGRGFRFLDQEGKALKADELQRCKELVIPPAWTEVWICPQHNGHVQAMGTDAAGRRQYLYHQQWTESRETAKQERILEVAQRLPAARRRVTVDLRSEGLHLDRVLAATFRLLDLGLFRSGGEAYAQEHGSFGLATLRRDHLRLDGSEMIFDFPAKPQQRLHRTVADSEVAEVVRSLARRRTGEELLAYKEGRQWRNITSRWPAISGTPRRWPDPHMSTADSWTCS